MKKFYILIFLIFVAIALNAQKKNNDSSKENSEFSKKFFMAVTTSTYTDILISPLKYFYGFTGNTDLLGNKIYADIPYQSMQTNIVTLGLEPRYNFKEINDNNAISVSIPFGFGIGSSISAAGDDLTVRGVEGFGSLQFPIIIKYNTGNGSTYNTQKDFGFNIGGGIEFSKVGLINLNGAKSPYNNFFVLPCFTTGITMMRGSSPMEINFKYAFGKLITQSKDTQGILMPENRNTRGQTLKLTFVYLLNY
ncbi:MAG: hypothetical protein IT243_11005 [Bacteroidia bacterium]|nr:hypothetical protein [Bacteroidia bacterium]